MQRDCQQDTCPVGIATQNCKLRSCFCRQARIRRELHDVRRRGAARDHGAALGFRTVDEMVGHPEYLRQIEVPGNWKANEIDLSPHARYA